jgi:hypothetical protein
MDHGSRIRKIGETGMGPGANGVSGGVPSGWKKGDERRVAVPGGTKDGLDDQEK